MLDSEESDQMNNDTVTDILEDSNCDCPEKKQVNLLVWKTFGPNSYLFQTAYVIP